MFWKDRSGRRRIFLYGRLFLFFCCVPFNDFEFLSMQIFFLSYLSHIIETSWYTWTVSRFPLKLTFFCIIPRPFSDPPLVLLKKLLYFWLGISEMHKKVKIADNSQISNSGPKLSKVTLFFHETWQNFNDSPLSYLLI